MFAALFTIATMWKQHECPLMDKWMKKKWHIQKNRIVFNLKNKVIISSVTKWMKLEFIKLSEISQLPNKY